MLNKILSKVQNLLFKSEEQEIELSTPVNCTTAFDLVFKSLTIGTLTLQDGTWTFAYSEAFKQQQKLTPVVDFPDKNRVYESAVLFPYFAFRIPSLQRLKIQKIVPNNITTDEVFLLNAYGKHTIVNPFQLIASH